MFSYPVLYIVLSDSTYNTHKCFGIQVEGGMRMYVHTETNVLRRCYSIGAAAAAELNRAGRSVYECVIYRVDAVSSRCIM